MVTAKIIDLPHDIHGLTTIAEDGSYVILLNAHDTRMTERQMNPSPSMTGKC